MRKIDANILLRYLLNDHADFSPKAKNIIDNNIVEIPIEALCEVVFVLHGFYNTPRMEVSQNLIDFFTKTKTILPSRDAVLKGIEYFGQTNLDFVDCILAGYYEINREPVDTFDKDLQKLLDKVNERNNQP
ncbi:MAG: hypothetical protein LBM77_06265 [Spirochaetaceae bacterium]|jgi:predicted nucleic-acid-binding protein|nr:hypothetical protein [Spirochaetaceae bacterium]